MRRLNRCVGRLRPRSADGPARCGMIRNLRCRAFCAQVMAKGENLKLQYGQGSKHHFGAVVAPGGLRASAFPGLLPQNEFGPLPENAALGSSAPSRPLVLSLATKDSGKDRSGERQSRTEWHRCIVWGGNFAAFAADTKKGAHLQVEGELRSREYEKDGVKHRIVEIRTKSILRLDRAKQQTEAVPQEAEPSDVPF